MHLYGHDVCALYEVGWWNGRDEESLFIGSAQGGGCEGEIVEEDGRSFVLFYGMSSSTAMDKHAGGVAEYRASEGKSVQIPYRGNVNETLKDILGGVRSACTYVGAARLKELSRRTTFIRVMEQENIIYGNE